MIFSESIQNEEKYVIFQKKTKAQSWYSFEGVQIGLVGEGIYAISKIVT